LTFNEKNVFCDAKKAFYPISAIAMDESERAMEGSVIAMDESAMAMDERERATEMAKKRFLPCIRE